MSAGAMKWSAEHLIGRPVETEADWFWAMSLALDLASYAAKQCGKNFDDVMKDASFVLASWTEEGGDDARQ